MEHFITLQEIFLVSYSILFGIMLNTTMGLGLFFFGWIWDEEGRFNKEPLIRIGASLFFINFIPFAYFALIFDWLRAFDHYPTFWQIIGTFFLALYVFGIYRVFHLIIYRFRNCLYGDEILNYPAVNRRLDDMGPSAKGHFVAILFYIVIAFIGAFWVKECQAFHDLYGWFILLDTWTCIVILIGFIGALFLLTRACAGPTENGSKPPDDECKSEKKEDDEFEQLYQGSEGNILKEDLDRLLKHKLDINLRIFAWRLSLIIPVAVLANQGMEVVRRLGLFWEIIGAVFVIIYFVHFIAEFKRFIRSQTHIRYFKEYIRIRRKLDPACS